MEDKPRRKEEQGWSENPRGRFKSGEFKFEAATYLQILHRQAPY
jgi:hypothetical protein